MNRKPKYEIVEETDEYILIRDVGPWDEYLTVTNGAEYVVEELAPRLKGRRLEYYDSGDERDQLLVKDGKFDGFAPCPGNLPFPQDKISTPCPDPPKTPIISVLYNQGWRIVACSCACGGRFAWLRPNGRMYGCICHNYPEEEAPA